MEVNSLLFFGYRQGIRKSFKDIRHQPLRRIYILSEVYMLVAPYLWTYASNIFRKSTAASSHEVYVIAQPGRKYKQKQMVDNL